MSEWIMAHPWMTFFIIMTALILIEGIICKTLNFFQNIKRVKAIKEIGIAKAAFDEATKQISNEAKED